MSRPSQYTNIRAPRAVPRRMTAAKMLSTVAGWITLLFATVPWGIFTPLAERPLGGTYESNSVLRITKLTLLAWGLITVLRHWTALRSLMHELNQFFVAFLVIVPMSYLWSISPSDTLARFVTILSIVSVWLAICLASWEPRRFQDISRSVTTFLILGSIVFVMISPELAIEAGEGALKDAWHGLASQKNAFGQLSSFGFIFWLHGWLARQVKTWKALVFGGCAAACILYSRSSTSLLASTFVAVFLLMLMRAPAAWRRMMPYLIAGFAVIVLTYALAVLRLVPGLDVVLEPIMALTGKDMTFSNRSVIWDIIKEHIQLSPFFGSGYGAYWIGADPTSPSYSFLQQMYFYPAESHNGYLEIVNDLGYTGLVVLCGYLILYVRQAVRLLRFDHDQAALYLAMFFQQAIINLSESSWLSVNAGLSFTIMTFATISLARSALDQRTGAPSSTLRPPGQAFARRAFR